MMVDLGQRFEILRNYFKRHACCRYNHATLDALEEIMSKRPGGRITPEEVVNVEVQTYSLAAQLCDQQPQNTLAGKFSIPFAVATTIAHGHTGVACFSPDAVQNQVVRDLAQKVKVVEDPELTAMMPGRRPSKLKITFADRSVSTAEAYVNKGDFEDPYSPEELQAKYYDLADLVWDHELSQKIYDSIHSIDEMEDVNQLTGLIAPLQ
jgi:2-methylcitrate dehydratase PrpD